jgi:replicative DNA helicase
MLNHMPGIFFSFAETKDQLRIRTLARLSGLDQREIRRGSAYLLHWYGVPRLAGDDSNELPPTWEKLKRVADEAKTWLDRIYLFECERDFTITAMEGQIAELRAQTGSKELMIVIDDTQRLWPTTDSWDARLQMISEQLQQTARSFNVPVLAVWPDLESGGTLPQIWAEKVPAPDVIVVMQRDSSRTETIDALTEAMVLHVVKNRGSEKGRLNYAFVGAFARFTEVQQNPRPSIDEAVR